MKKKHRVSALIDGLEADPSRPLDPCYQGWFTCFNARQYYEAHDVLEHLWLATRDENHRFYKGLIQIAGAFVHLQKQFLRPDHPKDGRRLRPAVRLFHLGINNVEPYGPIHLQLDVGALVSLGHHYAEAIVASEFTRNPWHPQHAPRVELLG